MIAKNKERVQSTDQVVCYCLGLTESAIRTEVKSLGTTSLDEVTRCIGAGGACTACHDRIRRIIAGKPANDGVFAACAQCGSCKVLCNCSA